MLPPAEDFADPSANARDPHEALLALRDRAERRRYLVTQAAGPQSAAALQQLVQELQVHQIELEMQQEELQLAQVALEQARAEYVDLYDFAPVGYLTLTPAGLIERLNLRASQQLGVARPRLVGLLFPQFVTQASYPKFVRFLHQVLATDQPLSCELTLQRRDGTAFAAQLEGLRVPPAQHPDAAPQCRLAVLDVSDRRRATDALAASEARFRQLFAESTDAVALLQGDQFVDCNAAALRLLGVRHRHEVVGRHPAALAPEQQPNGQRTADLLGHILAAVQQQGSLRCESQMYRAGGEAFWVEAVLTYLEDTPDGPLVHLVWRDITAERAAATQLRESEARLSLALDASETGLFSHDLATDLVWLDARAQAVLGRKSAAGLWPRNALLDLIHPADGPRVHAAVRAAVANQAVFAVDYRVVWADGSVRHVAAAGRAVADAQGCPERLVGVLRDVTARYAAEEELHYKTQVLERLLQNMPMSLVRFGPDGCLVEAMGAGLRALGLEDNALVGRNVFDDFTAYREPLRRVLAGQPTRFLFESEGIAGPVAFQNYGFFDEQRQQAVVLAVDVTEAEEQKRQLRQEQEFSQRLLENSLDGIIALDSQARVVAWNGQAAHYFGLGAAEALGQPATQAMGDQDPAAAQLIFDRVMAGEHLGRTGQPFSHPAGHYEVHYAPLRDSPAAAPTGVLIMCRDVTERDQRAEEAVVQRLRQQQEVLAAILSTQETERKRIAEALHNGLGQLLYATKLSLRGRDDATTLAHKPGTLKLLDEAIRAVRTISFELTPGILEDFGLRTALEELVKRIAPAGLPVALHLLNLDERLPLPVELSIYRVVQELLNNVMKHAQATDVTVHVAHENGRLEVSVEDNGRGFDPAALAAAPLAGIGLAGVRNRVALLGGTLTLNAQPGRGTIVGIELAV